MTIFTFVHFWLTRLRVSKLATAKSFKKSLPVYSLITLFLTGPAPTGKGIGRRASLSRIGSITMLLHIGWALHSGYNIVTLSYLRSVCYRSEVSYVGSSAFKQTSHHPRSLQALPSHQEPFGWAHSTVTAASTTMASCLVSVKKGP